MDMKITWYGQSCFQILTRQRGRKKEKVSIVIDPFSEEIGLKPPKLGADILLITHNHEGHNNIKAVSGEPFLIKGPGEYEVKSIFIQGIPAWHNQSKGNNRKWTTIYTIRAEGVSVCHLGDFGQKELTDDQIEEIGDVDILMIPIGGKFTISGKEALKIMSRIEPRITIPMHYKIPKLKLPLLKLDNFLEVLGIKSIQPEANLFVQKKALPKEEAKIVVLRPR